MENKFKCMNCGDCCRRILINHKNLTIGLCLLPNEVKLFKSFPGSVLPYIGLKKIDSSEIEILNYQMVIEPCPLLDLNTNQCDKYKKRPTVCKEYPFSVLLDGISLENKCSSVKSNFNNVEYGKTAIDAGIVQKKAMIKMSRQYFDTGERLQSDKDLRLMILDCEKQEWIGNFEEDFKP